MKKQQKKMTEEERQQIASEVTEAIRCADGELRLLTLWFVLIVSIAVLMLTL